MTDLAPTRPRRLNPMLAAAVLAVSAVTPAMAVLAEGNQWGVNRLLALAWVLVMAGLALGSDRIVTVAAAPALGGTLLGLWPTGGVAWGAALLIGILWFVVTAVARLAVAGGEGVVRPPELIRHRARETATVVLVTVAVGASAGVATRWAPERDLAVQAVALVLLLGGLLGLLRLVTAGTGQTEETTGAAGRVSSRGRSDAAGPRPPGPG